MATWSSRTKRYKIFLFKPEWKCTSTASHSKWILFYFVFIYLLYFLLLRTFLKLTRYEKKWGRASHIGKPIICWITPFFLDKKEKTHYKERNRNRSNAVVARLERQWLILSKIILVKCSFKLLSSLLFAYGYRNIIPLIASGSCWIKFCSVYGL